MEKADSIVDKSALAKQLRISKRKFKAAQNLELIQEKREKAKQDLGFAARAFIYCGLPYNRPSRNILTYRRTNGKYILEIRAHEDYGLPFGQDRLIPIFIATEALRQKSRIITFSAGAEILDTFGLPNNGQSYQRVLDGFNRIFEATIFFGAEAEYVGGDALWQRTKRERFNYLDSMDLWRKKKDPRQALLPGRDFQNVVELSERFWQDLSEHKTPVDLDVVRALAHAPATLDLFLWLCLRCHTATDTVYVPLFGPHGFASQLGTKGYKRPRKFRENLEKSLDTIRGLWKQCPVEISPDGATMIVRPGEAITTLAGKTNKLFTTRSE